MTVLLYSTLLLVIFSISIAFRNPYCRYSKCAQCNPQDQRASSNAYTMQTVIRSSSSISSHVMEFDDNVDNGSESGSGAGGTDDEVTRARRADIMNVLSNVIEPDIGSDIVTSEVMKYIIFDRTKGTIDVVIDSSSTSYGNEIAEQCVRLLDPYGSLWGVSIRVGQSQSVGSTIG